MLIRQMLVVVLAAVCSSSALAASANGPLRAAGVNPDQHQPPGQLQERRIHRFRAFWAGSHIRERRVRIRERRIRRVASVPELDGSIAFLALGLTFALVGVAREARRSG